MIGERGGESFITPRRIRARDRLSARLRTRRLDAMLAQGIAPECSTALQLRAQALIGPVARALGANLRTILYDARRAARCCPGLVPFSSALAFETADEMTALASRLLDGGPVDARGVAFVRTVICDVQGPLHPHFSDAADLRETLEAAVAWLDVAG